MLYIDDELPNIKAAMELHVTRMFCYLNRKINGPNTNCNVKKCPICNSQTQRFDMPQHLYQLLSSLDLKRLLKAKPTELLEIQQDFNTRYALLQTNTEERDNAIIADVFNYTWFSKNKLYDAYKLCEGLGAATCIYCNRLYTTTVITNDGEQIIRPTLDHWFPKSNFPLLALSFYNLIPSCTPCNSSIKHKAQFSLEEHVHPYLYKDITKRYHFRCIYDNSLGTFKVTIDTKDDLIKSSLAVMKIAEIYQHHQSELKDLDLLKRKYNRRYLLDLGKLLNTNLTEKDAYRLMFGVEFEDENFHKRPLSKLKKDVLNITFN